MIIASILDWYDVGISAGALLFIPQQNIENGSWCEFLDLEIFESVVSVTEDSLLFSTRLGCTHGRIFCVYTRDLLLLIRREASVFC